MSWTPIREYFSALPLILAGPILRRVNPESVTVWLALKEPRKVTLRVYARSSEGTLVQQFEGTRDSIRLGDHLHIVAVTARAISSEQMLRWGGLYYYDLFFQDDGQAGSSGVAVPENAAHLDTPGILNVDPERVDSVQRLVYPGHPLPSFVLPPEDVSQLRVVHGSCRKPHGFGREMLSALDTILEESIQEESNRPQQLFLTGDQIYADDVAQSLLFMLMDSGDFLFEGNEVEALPLVDASRRELAPGGRRDVVRNKAMFTTTSPQNQLLTLREYAAMYLFAWSDVLWPDDLPTIEEIWEVYPTVRPGSADEEKKREQYVASLERLGEFRSVLPQVRRALANIATYTMCDDHEVTDDWYLDGRWCRQVLDSALGRRVIRNGLLAYALFQAWGNTPEQFDENNGVALLNAVNDWRGEESDACEEIIERTIGLPVSFSGSGELMRSEQALHWNYTYEGPRYQVIVMDTRTQRFYRTPGEFPGLLSPKAMHTQLASVARNEAEVVIIISATPVIGVDFIESIQFWSHWRVRDNYAYDCEAWALEWGTFQHFLKTVSAMRRVVFLSGDVHYAFGSSLEYWDYHTDVTAKLVTYTSSPFHNEDAGAHIAILATGYPRLLHLLRREGRAAMDFLAWDITEGNHHIISDLLTLIQKRFYLFWWAIPKLIAAHRSPYEIVLPARGWLKGAFRAIPPDRVYRIHYLPNTLVPALPKKRYALLRRIVTWVIQLIHFGLAGVNVLEKGVAKTRRLLLRQANKVEQAPRTVPQPVRSLTQGALRGTDVVERRLEKRRRRLVGAILHYVVRLNRWKAGKLIIGYNNLGEISFQWTPGKKEVIQRLWWRLDDPEQPLQMTEYRDTLDPPAPKTAPPLP
jgi:hypothetical protein